MDFLFTKPSIFRDGIPKCKGKFCPGVVKPDIVFFGEDLPRRFYLYLKDMLVADLVIVMGTSLEVQPFAGIVDVVRFNVPRILFNMEAVGPFRRRKRAHDFVVTGDLTNSVRSFVKSLGWQDQMEELINNSEEHKQAWSKKGDNSSALPDLHVADAIHNKGANPVSGACSAYNNSPPKRQYHSMALNPAKSDGHRPRVFLKPPQRDISRGRGGLFPKLPCGSQFTRYRQISSSSSSSTSDNASDSDEEDSR